MAEKETIAEIHARLAALPEHHVYESKTLVNPSAGMWQFRAFCRCGAVSRVTDNEKTFKAMIKAHLQAHA